MYFSTQHLISKTAHWWHNHKFCTLWLWLWLGLWASAGSPSLSSCVSPVNCVKPPSKMYKKQEWNIAFHTLCDTQQAQSSFASLYWQQQQHSTRGLITFRLQRGNMKNTWWHHWNTTISLIKIILLHMDTEITQWRVKSTLDVNYYTASVKLKFT